MKNESEIDYEMMSVLSVEISDRFRLIVKFMPEEHEKLLKNIAASSLHLAIFSKELYEHQSGEELPGVESIKEFLDNCGCNDKSIVMKILRLDAERRSYLYDHDKVKPENRERYDAIQKELMDIEEIYNDQR